MAANAGRFGFVNPDWAAPHGEKPEPWHWEYGYIS
jgi:LAS superfamily LD-carboxypeptidase LdcB